MNYTLKEIRSGLGRSQEINIHSFKNPRKN